MDYSLLKQIKKIAVAAIAVSMVVIAPVANAGVIVDWNFENATANQSANIAASNSSAIVHDAYFNTVNNGINVWGSGNNTNKLAVTRWFNQTTNTPFLTFTLDQDVSNVWMSFNQFSNHNRNFPTSPSYHFALQLKVDNAWVDIKRDLVAQTANFGQEIVFNIGPVLKAGANSIRWIGYDYKFGTDSNTEYFALDNVKLYTVPEPAAVSLLGLALIGLYGRRRMQAKRAAC